MRLGSRLLGLVSGLGRAADTTSRLHLPPPRTVASVDLERYLGTWYEIASYPQRFQRGCTGTQATYGLRPDGDLEVVNRCRKGSLDGPEASVRGRARVVDRTTCAKLEVSFFRPFWGAYWILELGEDYDHAVVGHPSRDFLWILSRRPAMDPDLYEDLLRRVEAQGYDPRRLVRTVQPPAAGRG